MKQTIIDNLPYLHPFFEQDVFDLKDYPIDGVREKVRTMKLTTFDLSMLEDRLRLEIKFYLQGVLSKKLSKATLIQRYLRPIRHLINFLIQKQKEISLRFFSNETEDEYRNYLLRKGVSVTHPTHGKSVNLNIYERTYLYVNDLYRGSNAFDKDIWQLDEMDIDKTRTLESNKRKTITFYTIPNEFNKTLLKKYLKYLITTTDKAISTIGSVYNDIKSLLIHLGEKDITKINRSDVEVFVEKLNKNNLKNNSFNILIFTNKKFVEYLIVHGYLSSNPFYSTDVKNSDRYHSYKAVDESVIKQIFSKLDKIPYQESCMFLLLYATGLRVSEVCSIRIGSIFKNEKGYFIRFHSQKMRKEVVNPIPPSLYKLLEEQEEKLKRQSRNNNYLFPNANLKIYRSGAFREKMQDLFNKLGITNPDGTLYQFKPHDYRHTLATTMIQNEIPSSVIQKMLHHDSIEMTASYVDIIDQQKIEKHKSFINIKGKTMPIHLDESLNIDDLARVEWLKKSINAQMLPNGMCALPVAMEKCPHANSCLTCGEFRTSEEFLPVHEQHYQRVCSLIDYAKEKGWQRQVETNEEVKVNLEIMIKKLRNDDEVFTS